jgi:hypothetical protein
MRNKELPYHVQELIVAQKITAEEFAVPYVMRCRNSKLGEQYYVNSLSSHINLFRRSNH